MIFIYLIIVLLVLFYVYLTWNFNFWSKRGVPCPKPMVLLGDLPNGFLRKENVTYDFDRIYKEFKPKTPFVGIIQMRDPRLVILEPELIKDVFVRKFNSFRNNEFSQFLNPHDDPLFAMNPFFLQDEKWKEKRAEIIPAFTTSRIKALYPLIQNVSCRMIKYITTESKKSQPFETRELSIKFTIDVVSSCIFGIDAESFTKEKPEIREMALRVFSKWLFFKFFLVESFSILRHVLKLQFMDTEVQHFFVNLMQQALTYREENKIQREDFLDYVIQLRNKKNLSVLDMTSHSMSFFSNGFDTSSVGIAHAFYEIGKNKRVQNKLRKEIKENVDENGQISFEKLQEMTYLDQVLYETLRMHSAAILLTKACTETVDLEYDGKKITVEKGMIIYMPYLSVHFDPEYYLEPNTFLPERFDNGAVKDYLDRCLLLPFGAGPRICLGMKFAILQSKVAIAALVHNFEISVNPKTQEPLKIDPKEVTNFKIGGVWVDFKPLNEK